MRTTRTMTISLPPALLEEFETIREVESRTRSELVREALRFYFEKRYPVVEASREELAAIRRGRAAFARGDHLSLEEVLNELESPRHRSRKKSSAKGPR